ncbi:hypothetical protein C8J57DRAFT_1722303 [Mycena rebaudengoi]|nr:hypothetical protein C8J57DRAFT_1722303 [Mycena rebaudengoi]
MNSPPHSRHPCLASIAARHTIEAIYSYISLNSHWPLSPHLRFVPSAISLRRKSKHKNVLRSSSILAPAQRMEHIWRGRLSFYWKGPLYHPLSYPRYTVVSHTLPAPLEHALSAPNRHLYVAAIKPVRPTTFVSPFAQPSETRSSAVQGVREKRRAHGAVRATARLFLWATAPSSRPHSCILREGTIIAPVVLLAPCTPSKRLPPACRQIYGSGHHGVPRVPDLPYHNLTLLHHLLPTLVVSPTFFWTRCPISYFATPSLLADFFSASYTPSPQSSLIA